MRGTEYGMDQISRGRESIRPENRAQHLSDAGKRVWYSGSSVLWKSGRRCADHRQDRMCGQRIFRKSLWGRKGQNIFIRYPATGIYCIWKWWLSYQWSGNRAGRRQWYCKSEIWVLWDHKRKVQPEGTSCNVCKGRWGTDTGNCSDRPCQRTESTSSLWCISTSWCNHQSGTPGEYRYSTGYSEKSNVYGNGLWVQRIGCSPFLWQAHYGTPDGENSPWSWQLVCGKYPRNLQPPSQSICNPLWQKYRGNLWKLLWICTCIQWKLLIWNRGGPGRTYPCSNGNPSLSFLLDTGTGRELWDTGSDHGILSRRFRKTFQNLSWCIQKQSDPQQIYRAAKTDPGK